MKLYGHTVLRVIDFIRGWSVDVDVCIWDRERTQRAELSCALVSLKVK